MHENHGKENYRRLFVFNILSCPNIPPKWAFRIMSENNHLLLWSSCLCPPKIHIGNLTSRWRLLPSWLGLVPSYKRTTQLPGPFCHGRTQPASATWKRLSFDLVGWYPLHLRFAASRTMRNKSLLFTSYSFCCILLQQPEQTDNYFLSSVAMATLVTLRGKSQVLSNLDL